MVVDQVRLVYVSKRQGADVLDFEVHLEPSSTACTKVEGYVGHDRKLYVKMEWIQDMQSLIQCAAWLVAHETWLVEMLERERDKVA